jgi:hypothetical protein
MTDLSLSLLLLLVAGPAVALTGFLFHPLWPPLTTFLEKFAAPIAGALTGIEKGTHDLQRYLRSMLRSSAKWFRFGDGSKPVPGWPWRYVVRPLLSLIICVILLLIELDVGALGWQAILHTGPVPDLHLPLSLLQGMMLPLVGIAFAEAFFDALDRHSAGPWSTFGGKARWVVAALLGAGLAAGVVANVFFFAWRFGQLDGGRNPYDHLGSLMNFMLGALLYLGPVVAGAVGLRFLTIVVPAFLTVACGVLLAVEKTAQVVRIALEAAEAAGKFVLVCLTKLGDQFGKVVEACVNALCTGIKWVEERIRPRGEPGPVGPLPPPRPPKRCAFCSYLGRSILVATRAFWKLVHDIVHGLDGAWLGIARLLVAIVRGIGGGIRVTAIGVGHAARAVGLGVGRAARAVGIGVGRAAAAVGRAIWTCVVGIARAVARTATALGRAAVAIVKPVLLLAVAIAIWLFYWPARIVWAFLRWLCRFDFWSKRMHLNPPQGPPPREKMHRRLDRLARHDPEAAGLLFRQI